MKKTVVLLTGILALSACNQVEKPQQQEVVSETITKDEALGLLHTWTNAYLSGDAAPLIEVLDDSWVYSGSGDGSTSNKVATIDEFSSADYSFDEIKYQNLDVRLYGDIAVVRGSERMVILDSTKQDTTILRLRFTDVYQKKDGKVKAIATHSSPIVE